MSEADVAAGSTATTTVLATSLPDSLTAASKDATIDAEHAVLEQQPLIETAEIDAAQSFLAPPVALEMEDVKLLQQLPVSVCRSA
jgi:hypothetical protein